MRQQRAEMLRMFAHCSTNDSALALQRLLARACDIQPRRRAPPSASFLLVLFLMGSYYILRPVRDATGQRLERRRGQLAVDLHLFLQHHRRLPLRRSDRPDSLPAPGALGVRPVRRQLRPVLPRRTQPAGRACCWTRPSTCGSACSACSISRCSGASWPTHSPNPRPHGCSALSVPAPAPARMVGPALRRCWWAISAPTPCC